MENNAKLLIIDDERVALKNLEHVMKKEGYEVTATQSGQNAIKLLEEQHFDVVLTDLKMEKVDGLQILQRARELYPDSEVIMITGFATLQSAVDAMKHGAFYYIAKPFKLDEVRKVVKEAAHKVALKRENRHLREQLESYQGKVKIVTQARHYRSFWTWRARWRPWTPCPYHRRKRNGQGALRPVPPCEQQQGSRAVLRDQLWRLHRGAAVQRTVRL
jgi:DNA-binding NtrC family response regulator